MKKFIYIALASMALILAGPEPGHAFRGGHGGHVGVGVWVGQGWGPWWGGSGWPYYYPYNYPYYTAPPAVVQQPPVEYVQPTPQPEGPYYWYFCQNPEGYYPYVKRCPNGWMKVVPSPPPPKEKVAQPGPEPATMTLLVEFDTNKANIKPEFNDEIARVADFMKKYPTVTTTIEGHTDNIGSMNSNMELSQRRAESVKSYLVEKYGIEPSRLRAKGYGPTKPVADNKTAAGRLRNRRTVAVFETMVQK
ncbi:MAG: OmpA family protein [Geobacteraceae bacterium]|jgi:outer membrane protein OmpA-like peptidoglycan-associated protein